GRGWRARARVWHPASRARHRGAGGGAQLRRNHVAIRALPSLLDRGAQRPEDREPRVARDRPRHQGIHYQYRAARGSNLGACSRRVSRWSDPSDHSRRRRFASRGHAQRRWAGTCGTLRAAGSNRRHRRCTQRAERRWNVGFDRSSQARAVSRSRWLASAALLLEAFVVAYAGGISARADLGQATLPATPGLASVSGSAQCGAVPLAGATVQLFNGAGLVAATTADAAAQFIFPPAAPGVYTVRVSSGATVCGYQVSIKSTISAPTLFNG